MKEAVKKYNRIMKSIGCDHVTYDTEGWNLRDMVAEMQFQLNCFYEDGHMNAEGRYSEDSKERAKWKSDTTKLKKFIEAYKPFICDMECTTGHSSCFG